MSQRILVADDRASSRELLRAVLASAGYDVVEAEDGVEALARLREQSCDLVILDLQMPRLDGFGALAAIRADAALQHLPVVALTANAMAGDREQALAAGFSHYISKPVNLAALRREVAALLAGHGR